VDSAYLGEARLRQVRAGEKHFRFGGFSFPIYGVECVDRTPPCHLEKHFWPECSPSIIEAVKRIQNQS